MKKPKKHAALLDLTRESPAARKQRVTGGPQQRPTVFENKKRRAEEARRKKETKDWL